MLPMLPNKKNPGWKNIDATDATEQKNFLPERLYCRASLYRQKFHDFQSQKIHNPCTFRAGETDPLKEFFQIFNLWKKNLSFPWICGFLSPER